MIKDKNNEILKNYRTCKTVKEFMTMYLEESKLYNSYFSLRSMASLAKISPAQLSGVLSGKRSLTWPMAEKISQVMKLNESQKKYFFKLVADYHQQKSDKSLDDKNSNSKKQLTLDEFHILSNWYHFAILSLASIQGARLDIRWISRKLGILPIETQQAIERLSKLNLLVANKDGTYRANYEGVKIDSGNEYFSSAIRRYHLDQLKLAAEKLESLPTDKRQFFNLTLAVNQERFEEVKELINEFKNKMDDLMKDGPHHHVYSLNINFIPLTK
jgi:uncharacterized protein (TIGR02147 family)